MKSNFVSAANRSQVKKFNDDLMKARPKSSRNRSDSERLNDETIENTIGQPIKVVSLVNSPNIKDTAETQADRLSPAKYATIQEPYCKDKENSESPVRNRGSF